jgi:hypothetical protein
MRTMWRSRLYGIDRKIAGRGFGGVGAGEDAPATAAGTAALLTAGAADGSAVGDTSVASWGGLEAVVGVDAEA